MTSPRGRHARVPAHAIPHILPPPVGVRYDRLARTIVHRWWRPVVGTLTIVGVYVAVTFVLTAGAYVLAVIGDVPLARVGSRFFRDPLLDLGYQLTLLSVTIPIVFGVAWLVQRRPPGTLSSVDGRLRMDWLLRCLSYAIPAVLLGEAAQDVTLTLTGLEVRYDWAGWEGFLSAIVLIVLLVPFQAAAEEYAFRGWILQAFGTYTRNPLPGLLVGSAAFAALHGYTDWGIVYVFGFGVLMGVLAIKTGGLEAPIALHVANNVFAFGLSAAGGELGRALEQGSLPWQFVVGTAVQFAVYTVAILIDAQKWAIRTLSH